MNISSRKIIFLAGWVGIPLFFWLGRIEPALERSHPAAAVDPKAACVRTEAECPPALDVDGLAKKSGGIGTEVSSRRRRKGLRGTGRNKGIGGTEENRLGARNSAAHLTLNQHA